MKPNVEDSNFMDGMKELLGMEREAVEKLLDNLDADSLLELTDAIADGNKEEAQKVISQDEEINSLFFNNNEVKKKKHPVKPAHDHQFSYGDDVAVKTTNDETGEHEFVSATVYKPHAPGNTVGVKIEGKSKMVDKGDIYKLEENVMGMIGIPNLARMQQLAGIQAEPEAELASDVLPPSPPQPVMEPPLMGQETEEACPVTVAMDALDAVATVLPNIRLADLKAIRQKIYDLQAKMNESISGMPEGRPRKK